MAKFLEPHRRPLGGFEIIDVVEESDVEAIRSRLDVPCPTAVRWNDWDYGSTVAELRALYDKGKQHQWDASHELDWELPLTRDVWIGDPNASILASTCKQLGGDEKAVKAALFDEVNYVLSQLLHGEQAALQLCGQLTNICPETDEKLYAAQQAADEARHTEVFARFLAEKFGTLYPVSPVIKTLLDELLSAEGFHKKTLGMQTLFEGVAMGIFSGLRASMSHPLLVEMIRRVELDESRHAAFGVLTMRRVMGEIDEAERAELEDWALSILETLNAAQQMHMLRILGPKYGIDAERLTKRIVAMPEFPLFNSMVYMHTVIPNLQRLGLITERTESKYRAVGLMSDIRGEPSAN
ncbi:MAG: diiron oxygenase [Myxococcales bacterium]|nr:diiron oxygenase [Myxococcales bacterium]